MTKAVMNVSDIELEAILNSDQPALLVFSRGDDLRGDCSSALKNAAAENPDIVVAQINPDNHPGSRTFRHRRQSGDDRLP